ncbi:MAG: hypothetical protein H0X62_08145, partial [Bacteroidetes bacterium]|nr:hypothetical protein [Bacteroidota bacterium]
TWQIISLLIAALFIFSLAIKNVVWFKPYFTSKFNILSSKERYQKEFDFSKEILFEKLIEVLDNAGFTINKTNKETGEIFATSSISWSSWGENIYIEINEINDKTIIDFYSVCFIQIISWGKNKRNYDKFLNEFEKSLTI